MATGDLTTVANAKAWLNVQTTTDDLLLARLVSAASQFVQSWLNRTIAVTDYVDSYTGTGSETLALANYPCTAISSLVIAGRTVLASPDGLQTGFIFDERFIYLIGNALGMAGFPGGAPNRFPSWPPKCVQVSYTAGYADTPLDIEQAVLELMALKYADRQHFGQVSKSLQGEVVSFFIGDMPAGVKTLLNNYRKVVPV